MKQNLVVMYHSLLPPATKLGQGNIFRNVCQEFCSQGGGLPQCMLGYQTPPGADPPPGADTPHPWEQTPPPQEQTPPPSQCMLGDTAKIRAVRILLECILVSWSIHTSKECVLMSPNIGVLWHQQLRGWLWLWVGRHEGTSETLILLLKLNTHIQLTYLQMQKS